MISGCEKRLDVHFDDCVAPHLDFFSRILPNSLFFQSFLLESLKMHRLSIFLLVTGLSIGYNLAIEPHYTPKSDLRFGSTPQDGIAAPSPLEIPSTHQINTDEPFEGRPQIQQLPCAGGLDVECSTRVKRAKAKALLDHLEKIGRISPPQKYSEIVELESTDLMKGNPNSIAIGKNRLLLHYFGLLLAVVTFGSLYLLSSNQIQEEGSIALTDSLARFRNWT